MLPSYTVGDIPRCLAGDFILSGEGAVGEAPPCVEAEGDYLGLTEAGEVVGDAATVGHVSSSSVREERNRSKEEEPVVQSANDSATLPL